MARTLKSFRREAMEIALLNQYPEEIMSALKVATNADSISNLLRKGRYETIEKDFRANIHPARKSMFNVGVVVYTN